MKADSKRFWSPDFPFFHKIVKPTNQPNNNNYKKKRSSSPLHMWLLSCHPISPLGENSRLCWSTLACAGVMGSQRQPVPSHTISIKDLFKKLHAAKWCNRNSKLFSFLWDEHQHKCNNKLLFLLVVVVFPRVAIVTLWTKTDRKTCA